jgi:hypothetical protein
MSDVVVRYPSVGSINEGGFIQSLNRKGFTFPKCLLELIANCLDADASTIKLLISDTEIRIIDNGRGMNGQGVSNMTSMHRENHSTHPKRGVSGLGSKAGGAILSGGRSVTYFTRQQSGMYLRVVVPWDKINREKRYTGMCEVYDMSVAEILKFSDERDTDYGTTVVFPYSDKLKEVIMDNANPVTNETTNLEDRIGVAFGIDDVKIIIQKEGELPQQISMYNYFGESADKYYGGVQEDYIEQYERIVDGVVDTRFILKTTVGLDLECNPRGRGVEKVPQEMANNLSGYEKVGEGTVVTGVRKDNTIYNEADPKWVGSGDEPGQYNKKHLGKEARTSKQFRQGIKVRRNKQFIGTFETPDRASGSSRADPETHFKMCTVQCEFRFAPISKQDNQMDAAIGVQENKNQLNGKAIPLALTRLVKYCKERKAGAVWDSLPVSVTQKEVVAPAVDDVREEEVTAPVPESGEEAQEVLPAVPELVEAVPEVLPAVPEVIEEASAEVPEAPVAVPEAPVTVLEAPTAIPEAPVVIPEAPVRPPVDVGRHRRGRVTGQELISSFDAYCTRNYINMDTDALIGTHVELYNMLNSI